MNSVHFSSATDDWATPQELFDKVAAQHGPFDMDVCAGTSNAKAPIFFSKEQDGLAQTWVGRCWMNPPYGREIGHWMRKAYESAQGGGRSSSVLFQPAPTPAGGTTTQQRGAWNLSAAASSLAAQRRMPRSRARL